MNSTSGPTALTMGSTMALTSVLSIGQNCLPTSGLRLTRTYINYQYHPVSLENPRLFPGTRNSLSQGTESSPSKDKTGDARAKALKASFLGELQPDLT